MVFAVWRPTNRPRPPRADEAGGLYHALNRGNLRAAIFHNEKDSEAFERIVYDALHIHNVELFSFQRMPNHDHLVLRPLVDGEMSRFMGWIGGTHTMQVGSNVLTSLFQWGRWGQVLTYNLSA